MTKFSDCIDYILAEEGGYTNDPKDHGGCTNMGLTLEDCFIYIQSGTTTCEELKRLTVSSAKIIYRALYWNDNLAMIRDRRVATKMFDCMVNIGPFATV